MTLKRCFHYWLTSTGSNTVTDHYFTGNIIILRLIKVILTTMVTQYIPRMKKKENIIFLMTGWRLFRIMKVAFALYFPECGVLKPVIFRLIKNGEVTKAPLLDML